MGVSYVAAAAAAVAAVFDTEGFRIHVSNWDPGLVVSMLKIPGSIFRWCGEMIMSFSGGRLVVCAWVSQLETRLTSKLRGRGNLHRRDGECNEEKP